MISITRLLTGYMLSKLSILRLVLPDRTCRKVLNLSRPLAILSLDCLSNVERGIDGSLVLSISSRSSWNSYDYVSSNVKNHLLIKVFQEITKSLSLNFKHTLSKFSVFVSVCLSSLVRCQSSSSSALF